MPAILPIAAVGAPKTAAELQGVQGMVAPKPTAEATKTLGASFEDTLLNSINAVESAQQKADMKITNVATAKDADIHGTMIALEEANIAIRSFVSVRDKVVGAFQSVWSMQV